MKKMLSSPFSFLLVGLFIALIPYLLTSLFNKKEQQLNEAYKNYTDGESARTVGERKDAFNRALDLYTDLEKKNKPTYGNGKIYYDIANTYFQLEEYPWSILYYYRALNLMPGNDRVVNNLKIALTKVGLNTDIEPQIFEKIFFFHTTYSLPQRLRLFFLFGALALGLLSIHLWWPKRLLASLGLFAGVISSIFFLSILYTHYMAPIEAVIVQATTLHRDAGEQYAQVKKEPVTAGTKVEVLSTNQNGQWLKILTPDGVLGYVLNSQIRLIQE